MDLIFNICFTLTLVAITVGILALVALGIREIFRAW